MLKFKNYKKIIGAKAYRRIVNKAKELEGKKIITVNSTYLGGGVAEILNSLSLLLNDLGVNFQWKIIHGNGAFFDITKSFHNGLQGKKIDLNKEIKNKYLETNYKYSKYTDLEADLVLIHDPQPLPLIKYYKNKKTWIWRCHIDLSSPYKKLWKFIKPVVEKYDEVIISDKRYKQKIKTPQNIVQPAIDIFSDKNKELNKKQIKSLLSKFKIDLKKPIISQVSRYDIWKDPAGVIKVFEIVKKEIPQAQLVLLGNVASDDPEGAAIYKKLFKKYGKRKDIKLLMNVENNDLVVNALQRASTVVMQKSLKEGFGLTVSEAMYKQTPTIASAVGGIPLQIKDQENGFLHDPRDYKAFAKTIIDLLKNKKKAKKIGKKAKESVIKDFTIARLIEDWLDIFNKHLS